MAIWQKTYGKNLSEQKIVWQKVVFKIINERWIHPKSTTKLTLHSREGCID